MEASVKTLFEYLGTDKINKIPVYHRNYDWNKEHCTQLFKDIVKTGQGDNTTSHFIGSIIIAIINANIGKPEHIIIDGQQRITSSFLFLKALYDIEKDDEYIKKFVNEATVNKQRGGNVLKLELQRKDNELLRRLFSKNPRFTQDEINSNIYQNYLTFTKLIKDSKIDSKILENGFKRLKVVAISLQPNDSPQQAIFESINSTGMKLRTYDLIRNYILMQDVENQEKLYENYWYKIEEFLQNQDLENFIYNFIILKTGKKSTPKNIYYKFKTYMISENISAEKILKDMLFYAEIYSNIIFANSKDEEIKQLLGYSKIYKLKVSFSVVLESYANYKRNIFTKKDLINILSIS